MIVTAANIQDRDGAVALIKAIRFRFPWLRHLFADGAYSGPKLREAIAGHGDWTIEVVKRSDTAKGFAVIPRRWVVERTFAWLGRCHRQVAQLVGCEKVPNPLECLGYSGASSISVCKVLGLSVAGDLLTGTHIPYAAAWYRKTNCTFSDAIAAMRYEIWISETFRHSPSAPETQQIPPDKVKRMLQALCFAA